MSAKQDRTYTRTAAALEQKINLKERFAEVMGVATDARDEAEKASEAVGKLDNNLTSLEIFNRLTEDGTLQGLYRDENGNLYINANFIMALEDLFAKNITMSGKFTHKTSVFIQPEMEEVTTIQNHLLGTNVIPAQLVPLYDFNSDGTISISDMGRAQQAYLGLMDLSTWSGAKKTEVTLTIDLSNPDKFLRITGTNMWGRSIDKYIGVNFTNIRNVETEQRLDALEKSYVVAQGNDGSWFYRKWSNGTSECWGHFSHKVNIQVQWGAGYLSGDGNGATAVIYQSLPSGLFIETPTANISAALPGWVLLPVLNAVDTGGVSWYIWSPAQQGQQYVDMKFIVKGRWKY